jgi:hypothetical protein
MTYSTGMMWILIGCLIAGGLYALIYSLMTVSKQADEDMSAHWREFNRDQAKRRIEERAYKTRMGAR